MIEFIPKNYEIPGGKGDNFMRLQKGENRFRILSDTAVMGYEYWEGQDSNGKGGTPTRVSMSASASEKLPEDAKHFWLFSVWNFAEQKIQMLEITQRTIQKQLKRLLSDPDWGSPKSYDLVIFREGESIQDTRYSVQQKPASPIDEKIVDEYEKMGVDLTAIYRGEDPFKPNS